MMEYLRFGELYAIPSSNGLSRPSAVRGAGYKMVNMGELFSNGIINDIPMERVQMSDKELSKFLLEKGDLLFARQSLVAEDAGKCSYVNDLTEETTFESHLIRVRLNPKRAISKYFYYLFQLPNNPIKTIVNQCAQAGIRGSELVRVKVPCPSIKVQKKIASILSAYDSQIENNQKRIKLLEQMAENLYKEWFVRFRFPGYESAEFKDGTPIGWKDLQAQDVFNITIGRTPSRKVFEFFSTERENNCSWISISDMKNGMFIKDTSEYLTPEALKACNMPMVKANTVLLSFKLTVGKVAISLEETSTNEAIAHFNTDDHTLKEYTYLYLKCFNYSKLGNTSAIGNAINSTIVKNMSFILPSKDIILEFHKQAKPLFDGILNLTQQISSLTHQRDLLLPRLMSGKLSI